MMKPLKNAVCGVTRGVDARGAAAMIAAMDGIAGATIDVVTAAMMDRTIDAEDVGKDVDRAMAVDVDRKARGVDGDSRAKVLEPHGRNGVARAKNKFCLRKMRIYANMCYAFVNRRCVSD